MKVFYAIFLLAILLGLNVDAQSKQTNLALKMAPILASANQNTQQPTGVKTVVSAGGQIWMDRNLGASRVATSPTDSQAYGDLYQWGRLKDAHQERTSLTTTTLSTSNIPGHGKFILGNGFDWKTSRNDNLWQGKLGINNPCPTGFRLPVDAEWEIERNSWSSITPEGAFASPLKLPTAGYRSGISGTKYKAGERGMYWSSDFVDDGSYYDGQGIYLVFFNTSSYITGRGSLTREGGLSVRCIEDEL